MSGVAAGIVPLFAVGAGVGVSKGYGKIIGLGPFVDVACEFKTNWLLSSIG
jgi:hypothetical protein